MVHSCGMTQDMAPCKQMSLLPPCATWNHCSFTIIHGSDHFLWVNTYILLLLPLHFPFHIEPGEPITPQPPSLRADTVVTNPLSWGIRCFELAYDPFIADPDCLMLLLVACCCHRRPKIADVLYVSLYISYFQRATPARNQV